MKENKYFTYLNSIFIIIFAIVSILAYILFKREPIVFMRVLKLWPIALLITSIIFQFLYFETNLSLFLPIGGFIFIYGSMYTLNLHKAYINKTILLPIFLLALSSSFLNLYTFKKRNDLILPFIFILILISIFLILKPFYNEIFNSLSDILYINIKK